MTNPIARVGALSLLGVALATLVLLASPGVHAQDGDVTYAVSIQNLTDTQPFTPPVVAAHSSEADVFEVGEAASAELAQIAENGNNDPLVAALGSASGVVATATGDGPIMPGATATISIDAAPGDLLSAVFMLICTNDGFSGVDSWELPASGSESVDANAYDAGSEMNTEDFADIVPPCQELSGVSSEVEGTGESNPALAENGTIVMHAGVEGGVDLTVADHGWTEPVARITVEAGAPDVLPSSGTGLGDTDGGVSLWLLVLGTAGTALLATGGAFAFARRTTR